MKEQIRTIGFCKLLSAGVLLLAGGCQVDVAIGPRQTRADSIADIGKAGARSALARDDARGMRGSKRVTPNDDQTEQDVAAWSKTTARRARAERTQSNVEAGRSEPLQPIKVSAKKASDGVIPISDTSTNEFEPAIQLTQHRQLDNQTNPIELAAAPRLVLPDTDSQDALLPQGKASAEERYPIDLATALQLAGANNLQIALASERVQEAQARLEGAEVLWVPSVNAGFGYNKHDGRIQETDGIVRDVSRNSTFVGGGLGLSGAPLTGGSSGPARLFVDISPVDIYFEPLAARQSQQAAQASEVVAFNDTLLEVTIAYLELVRSQSQVAIAEEALKNVKELVGLTEEFARTGAGLEADAARARAELADRRRESLAAQERVQVVSTELARLLRLDQDVVLFAVESQPVPLPMVSDELPLEELVAQALSTRPELSQHQALVAETLQRMRQEQWRPWIPNVHLGASAGGFGGGEGSFLGNFDGRSDFDALAVWELRNLGLGNRSVQRERSSQHRQAHLVYTQIQDQVVAEVTRAYKQVQSRKDQIEQARIQVKSAAAALPLNFNGIRGRELRAIEAQQAIAALATARQRYLSSVIDYDRAQFVLLRAIGRPPESPVADQPSHNPQSVPPVPASSDDE